MKLREGQSRGLQVDKRHLQFSATYSIGDTYDALVELITNADDSYSRLFRAGKRSKNGGEILIEHFARRGERSSIVVRDRAEGMDSDTMEKVMSYVGKYTSEAGDRGFMGRGAKDCCAIGDLVFESIRNGKYYRCSITTAFIFTNEVDGRPANQEIRERLGIPHRNGTSVTLTLRKGKSLPHFDVLASTLPNHYALRQIMSEESDSRVLLFKGGSGADRRLRLVYRPPEGELVVDETYQVEGYKSATARLRIWQTPEPLEDSKDGYRFERYGILVAGERAVHECSVLSDALKSDYDTHRFFGVLECAHIDALLKEYEAVRTAGGDYPETNPTLLLDPSRRQGLQRQHPFTTALLGPAIAKLRDLLGEEKRKAESSRKQIANEATKRCLDRLARLAAKYLEATDEASVDSILDHEEFASKAMFLYPDVLNVGVGLKRTVSVYLRSELAPANHEVMLRCDEPHALKLSQTRIHLHPHKKRANLLIGSFSVKGITTCPAVVVSASAGSTASAESILRVVEIKPEDWDFNVPLEFERSQYEVRENRTKQLRLLARSPELVQSKTEASVWVGSRNGIAVIGRCWLEPVPHTNYAEGFVTIRGTKLKARSKISAKVDGFTASVKVVERERKGPPIRIEFVPEDFVTTRAKWADDEGRPNVLKIGAKHKAIAPHMGSEEDVPPYSGQNTPVGRVLIAEVVAESVCRKELVLDALNKPEKFRWTQMRDHPAVVADAVLVELQRRMGGFLAEAHPIALRDLPSE